MDIRKAALLNVLLFGFFLVVYGESRADSEYAIREKLLTNYDKTVRPSGGPDFEIRFGAMIRAIEKVDDKEQTITVSSWVVMQWNNSFFGWNKTDYKGTSRVHFLPSEVWFPDIALYNNGNPLVSVAGGRTKFQSNVIVNDGGLCIWSGPASFTATCDIGIKYWPFDEQSCEFDFSSFSYDSQQVQLKAYTGKKSDTAGNSNWAVDSLTVKVGDTDRGDCCPYTFSHIQYTLKIKRLFSYQMFYIFAPCCILTILAIVSFWIPSESGERIGFVTTLLLSLMVYLLVVPESLPISSKEIPVLGLIIMITLVIISLVLLATIVVLVFFHRTEPPSRWTRYFGPSSKSTHVKEIEMEQQKSHASLRAVHPSLPPVNITSPPTPEKEQPSKPDDGAIWREVANKLDIMFFFIFLVASIIIYVVLLVDPTY